MGKRLHGEFFLDELDAGHSVEGCNYLLALEMEMDPVPGYAIASWERGYGDFGMQPDLATLRRIPWLEATALVLCDVGLARRLSGRAVAAAGAQGAGGARGGARAHADGRLRARVLPAAGDVRRGARAALPRPDAVGALHPRLPHPRDDLRRAVHPPDPERHARGGHQGRDVQGRGLARPARDQLPLRRRGDDGGQPLDLQERGEGDRAPERLRDHLHGEARPHLDRQLVSHPLVALARHRERVRGRDARSSRAGSQGRSPAWASWRSSLRRTSIPTSATRRGRGRRRRSPGGATTGRAGSASSVTARRCGRRRGSPAPTRTRISRSRR